MLLGFYAGLPLLLDANPLCLLGFTSAQVPLVDGYGTLPAVWDGFALPCAHALHLSHHPYYSWHIWDPHQSGIPAGLSFRAFKPPHSSIGLRSYSYSGPS